MKICAILAVSHNQRLLQGVLLFCQSRISATIGPLSFVISRLSRQLGYGATRTKDSTATIFTAHTLRLWNLVSFSYRLAQSSHDNDGIENPNHSNGRVDTALPSMTVITMIVIAVKKDPNHPVPHRQPQQDMKGLFVLISTLGGQAAPSHLHPCEDLSH